MVRSDGSVWGFVGIFVVRFVINLVVFHSMQQRDDGCFSVNFTGDKVAVDVKAVIKSECWIELKTVA